MRIIVNDERHEVAEKETVASLLEALKLRANQVAVERNGELVVRRAYSTTELKHDDRIEIVTLVGGGETDAADLTDRPLVIGGRRFNSRLLVGTGKYATFDLMRDCLEAAGTDCVTVAVRRVKLNDRDGGSLLDYVDRSRYLILPNTAGCYSAADAVRYAKLSRDVLETDFVKLEVLADERTLLPDPPATLEAVKLLADDGFTVFCYTSDDPVMAKRIEEAGAACVMPAGSPIGSGQGVLNPNNIKIILERADVPIICDAGVGTASDVAVAMELGCHGVLLNTAVAHAEKPITMARAMKHAVEAGRLAYLAGRIPKRLYATASSPIEGHIKRSVD